MFTEYDSFKNEYNRIQGIILQLENDKRNSVTHKTSLEQTYADMLIREDVPQSELSTVKKNVRRLEQDIRDIDERIEAIRSKSQEHLCKKLDEVKAGRDREVQIILDELDRMIPEARRYKAELLGFFVRLNHKFSEARTAHNFLLEAAHSIGVKDFDRYWLHLPQINLTSNYSGEETMLAPTEDEIHRAYSSGTVQPWVKLFLLTDGREFIPNNVTASARLKELEVNENDEK